MRQKQADWGILCYNIPMLTVETFQNAETLTAARVTADHDAWLSNETDVMSYAIPIGRVVLASGARRHVDRFTQELDFIFGRDIPSALTGDPRGLLSKFDFGAEEYREVIAQPYTAVAGLAMDYALRCDSNAQPSYPSDAAFGLHTGIVGGYHTDHCENRTPDQPITLRFATFWGKGGPTRFAIGPRRRSQMRHHALLIGTPADNDLDVVTHDEGVVVCFAGAHGIHATSNLTGPRLFITTTVTLPAVR